MYLAIITIIMLQNKSHPPKNFSGLQKYAFIFMFMGLQIGCGLADLGCNWLDASRL